MPAKEVNPAFFAEAIASVRDQRSPWWQLIVVVEHDERERIITWLGAWRTDRRIQVVVNEGVRLAGATNTGMRHARTEFVALLLADDRWDVHAVSVLSQYIAQHRYADFFHSARRIIDDDGNPISSVHPARHHVTLRDFRLESPVKHLLCWRRSLGLTVGGLDERSASVGPDDFDFPWTMAEHGAVFHAVDECLYEYRDHRDGVRLTTHLPRTVHVREMRRVLRKHGLGRRDIRLRIRAARKSYLQQCLYRSRTEARIRQWLNRPPRIWRDTYR